MKRYVILILVFFLSSCSKEKHYFKIEMKDNIEIATNSDIPFYSNKKYQLELKQCLVIGKEEGESNYVLNIPHFIGMDEDRNIYILDRGDAKVLVYNENGEFIHSFGRKGQGPGEFINPYPGIITNQHNILVIYNYANFGFQLFKRNGQLLDNFSLEERTFVNQVLLNSAKNIISLETNFQIVKNKLNPLAHQIRIVHYTRSGEIISTMINQILTTYEYKTAEWTGRSCMSLDKKGNIYINSIDPNKYEISVYNPAGKIIKKIMRKAKRIPYSVEEINRSKKAIEARKSLTGLEYPIKTLRPYVRHFTFDSQDRLWVWTGEYDYETGMSAIDIFDEQGEYLFKYYAKLTTEAKIIDNKVYQIEGYPDEFLRLVVYEIIESFQD